MLEEKSPFNLELFIKLLALVVPCAFALSVLHDWGYYKALGLNFNEIPFTWTDQLRFSLAWLPGSLSLFMVGGVWAYTIEKAQRDVRTKDVWEDDNDYQKRIAIGFKIDKLGFAISTLCFAVGALIWVVWGDTKWANMSSVLLFWINAVYWLGFSKSSIVKDWLRPAQWLLIIVIPLIWAVPFITGFYSADIQKLDLISIETKTETKKIVGYRLVRVYERGVLVTDGATMLFVANDQITQISRAQMQYKFIGVVGKWWP